MVALFNHTILLCVSRRRVLRSKGFVWLSSSHGAAHYWSHAGQHFEVREEGDWWADVPEDEWPDGAEKEAILRGEERR